jgi:precorrin-6A synthase
MRKLKLIGIGAGNPDYITVQAINALREVDVIFAMDKGEPCADLLRVRKEICQRYMHEKPYRIIEIQDPERDRSPSAYKAAVAEWHEKRAALYARLIGEELSENECGAFLIWGDPSLYDSALRIVDHVVTLGTVEFDWEIIPGITSVQALAARHNISLNKIGEPIHITTGRRLSDERRDEGTNVLVLLDGQCAFKTLDEDVDIYWGAYLGTPDEILVSGRLGDVAERIESLRGEARDRMGWIMDTYLLRRRSTARDTQ